MTNKIKTTIMPLGDLHVGAKTFNRDLFEQWLKDAKNYCKHGKRKGKGYILLNGDLCDFARATQDAWSSTMTATEQIDFVVEALEPFQDNIIGSTISNHSSRAYREFNLDVGQEISNRLDIPYSIDLFHDVEYSKSNYKRIFARHGTRFSKSYLLFMRNFIADMNNIEADVFIQGHSHFLGSQTRIVRTADGVKKKHYVVNGAFIDYMGSYAQKSGYDMRLAGYPIISFDADGEFNCVEKWADI